MPQPTSSFLLENTELVAPVAPWCIPLDNLELGILLIAQPWIAGGGMRRADLERQLSRLGPDLPVGPIYFQRVSRVVARLEGIDAVRGEGGGRARRFVATPRGLAALILNLGILRQDPTIDGSEFELKRSLVAMWHLVFHRAGEVSARMPIDPELEAFFDELESIELLGRKVITDERMRATLDILSLVERQRRRVRGMLETVQGKLSRLDREPEGLSGVELTGLAGTTDRAVLALVRSLASKALPALGLQAAVRRYQRYLDYLDDLGSLHAEALGVINLGSMRRLAGSPEG